MAFGATHATTGAMIGLLASSPIGLAAGIPLAFFTHWPLDDLNVGNERIWHVVEGHGRLVKWAAYAFRGICWAALVYIVLWVAPNPWYPASCAFAACFLDLIDEFPRLPWKGMLHRKMFPVWIKGPKAYWVWVGVAALSFLVILSFLGVL